MRLIEQVKTILDRLAPHGWKTLLDTVTRGKLDISAPTTAKLESRLSSLLASADVDRTVPGFEDFALGETRGITPGDPARSLIYHALASPGVLSNGEGVPLLEFPTLQELEIIENYVFAARKFAIKDVFELAGRPKTKLSVVVFACEYRPAKDTCAKIQADLAFSRTGIARVGTLSAKYHPDRRGFWAEEDGDPFAIRVCPVRYVAYLAVSQTGDPGDSLPMRPQGGDEKLKFWRPVHKLFDGDECLSDVKNLVVKWSAAHVNDKIRRIHTVALQEPDKPIFKMPPYRLTDGIAELSTYAEFGSNVLVPVPHPRLIEPAIDLNPDPDASDNYITFKVPKDNGSRFAAFEPETDENDFGEVRPAPAYVHARTLVKRSEDRRTKLIDLNNDPTHPFLLATVSGGDYEALHYVDFSGEGQVSVACDQLSAKTSIVGESLPAYSLVSAPDFFPLVGQRELSEWSDTLAKPVREQIWAVDPVPLCDVRLPANLQLPELTFDPDEATVTSIVSLLSPTPVGLTQPKVVDAARHSSLPDDAAGVFAPGWDVSQDKLPESEKPHLAAYGLGSPFPEDAKLCAALSTFWPAVAPDIARSLLGSTASRTGTVAPLSDEEIGQIGSLPWDGLTGPHVVTAGGQPVIEGASFLHADYIEMALNNRFSFRVTAKITLEEYVGRVLAMARIYRSMPPAQSDRNRLFVISFRSVNGGDAELQQAQSESGIVLSGRVFRVDLCRMFPTTAAPQGEYRRQMPIHDRQLFFASADSRALLKRTSPQTMFSRFIVDF